MTHALCLLASLLLGDDAPAFQPTDSPREIRAEERDAFAAWVDQRIGAVQKRMAAGQPLDRTEDRLALFELARQNVDWQSFIVPGAKNYEFPKMLFYNEFYKHPVESLHPQRWKACLTGVHPGASNVDPTTGEIPNSSFFTNTSIESYTPERIAQEFGDYQPRGPMKITKVKKGRTSEGLWIKDAEGKTYILIFDEPFGPEMNTSAEYIGSTLMRILGYHVPKTCIAAVDGTGDPMYDGRRVVATIALKDFKGGWRYASFRDRREIRALQLLGGWINNVDQTEQNTGMTVNDDGVIRHYVLDFGSSLGSFTFRPQMARLGWTRLFDAYQQFTQPLYNHGLRKVPWQAPYRVQSASVGYFTADYDPDRWQPFYMNLGFTDVTPEDRVWGAKRLARLTPEQIEAVVGLAGYTHASDREYVTKILLQRRQIILDRYLAPPTMQAN
jgi:hypothetical protein